MKANGTARCEPQRRSRQIQWIGCVIDLKNEFYIGFFTWAGNSHRGTHPLFVDPTIFKRVQEVLSGHNRPR
jgi:hypothetical protein